ncbi:MAG: hypothetical protein ACC628_04380 [Pirellulaceae bacterium]
MSNNERPDKKTTGNEATHVPNVWSMSSAHNPYLHNVFALLGLDPDADERTLQSQVTRIGRQLGAGQQLSAHGREVEETDVTRAFHLTANEVEFVAERLLAHTVHKADTSQFTASMEAIEAEAFEEPEQLLPLPIHDLSLLTRLLPDIEEIAASDLEPLSDEAFKPLVAPKVAEEQIYDL